MPRPHKCLRAGLGMIELLVALAITATLLASVAIAFHASLVSFDSNQKIAAVTQAARVALGRMMTEARRAEDVSYGAGFIEIIPPAGEAALTRYELTSDGLWYKRIEDGQVVPYPIILNEDGVTVRGFTCNVISGPDPATGLSCAKIVTAQLLLQVGGSEFAVNASTSPRRNQEW